MKIAKILVSLVVVVAMLSVAVAAVPSAERQDLHFASFHNVYTSANLPANVNAEDGTVAALDGTKATAEIEKLGEDVYVVKGMTTEDGQTVVGVVLADDGQIQSLLTEDEIGIISYAEDQAAGAEQYNKLTDAAKEVTKAAAEGGEFHDKVADFDDGFVAATSGAMPDDAVVDYVFYAFWKDGGAHEEAKNVVFSLKVDLLQEDDVPVVLHNPTGTDGYVFEKAYVETGDVTVIRSENGLSPFIVLEPSDAQPTPGDDAPVSPQTNVTGATGAAVAAVLFGALAVACTIKSRREH